MNKFEDYVDDLFKSVDAMFASFDKTMDSFTKKFKPKPVPNRGNAKQIIIIRKDLQMTKGKMIAQSCHASMGAILNLMKTEYVFREFDDPNNSPMKKVLTYSEESALGEWLDGKFTKICVYVKSEQELLDLQKAAKAAGIINCLIKDAGDTMFHGVPTFTALAIGPAYANAVDPITKNLPLL